MTIYTVEVQAHTGAGGVQTLYAASAAFNTGANDTPAHQHFRDTLETPANFERHLFQEGTTTGASSSAFGEIVLANADGRYDAWADYAFDGRPIIVRAIPQDRDGAPRLLYRDAPIMIRGTVENLDITDAFKTIRLRIHDRLADLDAKPLLATRYLGTTTSAGSTAEGPATLKDTLKPRVYGLVRGLTPIDVNPFNLIRQVSDRPCSSIVVYDGGLQLTANGDFGSIDALAKASLSAGQYGTCLALGLIRLGGTPALVVTADVIAPGARDAASLARAVLSDFGILASDIVDSSFSSLTSINGASCGMWVTDERTPLAVVGAMLASIGGWIISNARGAFSVGRLDLPSGQPVAAFKEWQLRGDTVRVSPTDQNGSVPAYRVTLRYAQLPTVFSEDQLAGAVEQSRRASLQQEWRESKVEDLSIQIIHPLARELTFDTCLTEPGDAAAEASRLLGIYSSRRDVWKIRVTMLGPQYKAQQDGSEVFAPLLQMGSIVSLQMARFLLTPKPLVLIGRVDDAVDDVLELSLWG